MLSKNLENLKDLKGQTREVEIDLDSSGTVIQVKIYEALKDEIDKGDVYALLKKTGKISEEEEWILSEFKDSFGLLETPILTILCFKKQSIFKNGTQENSPTYLTAYGRADINGKRVYRAEVKNVNQHGAVLEFFCDDEKCSGFAKTEHIVNGNLDEIESLAPGVKANIIIRELQFGYGHRFCLEVLEILN